MLKLVYEDGDPCPADPELKHKSHFSFVCKSDVGDDSRPVFLSFDEQTCTSYFSWHTSLACEEEVRINSVENTCGTKFQGELGIIAAYGLNSLKKSTELEYIHIFFY